jgi:hypothetical protein
MTATGQAITPGDMRRLSDAPGYGTAQRELRKAGAWNESAAFDGTSLFQVVVDVTGIQRPEAETDTITVTAASEKDASQQAEALSDLWEIHDVSIVAVRELPS